MVYISVPIIITKHHDGKFTVHVQHYKIQSLGNFRPYFLILDKIVKGREGGFFDKLIINYYLTARRKG